jgi:hypothetical protein
MPLFMSAAPNAACDEAAGLKATCSLRLSSYGHYLNFKLSQNAKKTIS